MRKKEKMMTEQKMLIGLLLLSLLRNDEDSAIKVLNKTNVDMKTRFENGNTVLMWALTIELGQKNVNVVKILVALFGSDVNATNDDGRTALMFAVQAGLLDATKVLLEHGANVTAKDKYGETALQLARGLNHTDIVELLRAHGATE